MSASSPSGTRSRCGFCACCCSCCWCSRAPAGEFFTSPNSLLPPPPARSSSTNNGGVQSRHRCQGALRCTAEQTPPAEKRPAADQRSRHSRPSNRSTTTPCPAAAAEARPHRTSPPTTVEPRHRADANQHRRGAPQPHKPRPAGHDDERHTWDHVDGDLIDGGDLPPEVPMSAHADMTQLTNGCWHVQIQ